MKTLAFLYNVRRHYPDAHNPRTFKEADFDDPKAIEWMITHIKNIGYQVIPIEANEKAYLTLYNLKKKIDLAFDFSFGLYGQYKYGHIASMLEMLRIPYVGSSSFTRSLTLNKVKMKQVLIANDISTLPYQEFQPKSDFERITLSYPLIVKPVAQGSSAGIVNESVVYTLRELKKQVKFIHETLKQAAFVEPFLTGREFSVPLLGNPPKILPIIEPDFSILPKRFLPLDSLEVKWVYEEETGAEHLICPANITPALKRKIEELSLKAWNALDIQDICRIDMRADRNGKLYILDVNSPPGLVPPEDSMTSYFPLAARKAGIDYEQLLRRIINAAIKRHGKI